MGDNSKLIFWRPADGNGRLVLGDAADAAAAPVAADAATTIMPTAAATTTTSSGATVTITSGGQTFTLRVNHP